MLRKGPRRISLSLLAALALGPSGVALADPPTLSIRQQATLLDPAAVAVVVEANCGDGPTSAAEVDVAVRQGEFTGESIVPFTSTGRRQAILVSVVGGPFFLGDAIATAVLNCATLIEGLTLGATIKITAP